MSERKKSLIHYALLVALIAAAAGIRTPHFKSLIPCFYHEDEIRTTGVTLRMFQDRTPNPRFEIYPGLPFYINGLAYTCYFFSRTASECLNDKSLEPIFQFAGGWWGTIAAACLSMPGPGDGG